MTTTPSSASPSRKSATGGKVMVIAEENEAESSVLGSSRAPYLDRLAATYGQVTNMQAGYPVGCPSLAAYILMTSGTTHGICDDRPPAAHPLPGNNIFSQVARAGRQWREYAESMTSTCERQDGAGGRYLVRHAPPPYYTAEAGRCPRWDVPLGTTTSGALQRDLSRGLPAFSFVTPDACNDMHGAPACGDLVVQGDAWLARWIPQVLASADYRSGRLVVIITWDEGDSRTNHIATVVISRQIRHTRTATGTTYTHCSTLLAAEQILSLPYLGCAAHARSYISALIT
ncbi:MAG: alkaline phosphatase family protein [Actinomycetota bacterium]|nr:alkaline phosphatase family protein [Actinomycetota bacterium]